MIIRRSHGWSFVDLRQLWEYRELIYFFAWRDIKVRYKQTVLGASWAGLQPFFLMVVFTIFFGNFAKMPSDGLPYPIFAFSALVPWIYFANAFALASNSMVMIIFITHAGARKLSAASTATSAISQAVMTYTIPTRKTLRRLSSLKKDKWQALIVCFSVQA